jgi:3-oxocholest-4-en-26-oate---CoA ligase
VSDQVRSWNFADVWDEIAKTIPDAPATVHSGVSRNWGEFERRSRAVADFLSEGKSSGNGTVAYYLHSCSELLETLYAAFKSGYWVANTNYRYIGSELLYLWTNCDAKVVVFHGEFSDRIASIMDQLPHPIRWLWVDDGTGTCPTWATSYEEIARSAKDSVLGTSSSARSGDDLLLLYTGGTTGLPKGVMWRQDDVFVNLNRTAPVQIPENAALEDIAGIVREPGPVHLPAAPLMHTTGLFTAFQALCSGGSVVTLVGRHFSAIELLDTIDSNHVKSVSIVGDAFARPIADALVADPHRWSLSSLRVVISSGVMWSDETKEILLRANPRLILVDTLGSTEVIGLGASITGGTSKGSTRAGGFTAGGGTRVITEDGRFVVPGSSETGRIAFHGRQPLGYFKDEGKSATTFQIINGVRWSIPGDWATIEADGTIRLLGRGSHCINTGGEKVYPEEVEQALKFSPEIQDAAVVGIPEDRFGQQIVALVEISQGHDFDKASLIATLRGQLAAYKVPRHVVVVSTLNRADNGKLPYNELSKTAIEAVGHVSKP